MGGERLEGRGCGGRRPGWLSAAVALYGAMLWAFPAEFRRRYGRQMREAFEDRCRAVRLERGRLSLAVWMIRSIADLARNTGAEHWLAWRARHPKRRAVPAANGKGDGPMTGLARDLRHAFKTLTRRPGFTAVAVLTLALGIGATSAVFSVLNGVLLKPLPYNEPENLVAVWHRVTSRGDDRFPQSAATYFTYQEENRTFQDFGIWTSTQVTVTGLDEPARLDAAAMTAGVLPALRVEAALGRRFNDEDDEADARLTTILSYGYWQRQFGGDRSVVGRTLKVNSGEATIIGVMPKDFQFFGADVDLLFPFRMDRSRIPPMGGGFGFHGLARLRHGVTLAEANADVDRMLALTVEKFPAPGFGLANLREFGMVANLIPLKQDIVGDIGDVLWVLLGTVGLVLLIACANVANLFLVRADSRRREVGVRAALGAGRGRIARQFLAESFVLVAVGGALALALAYLGLGLVGRLAPATLPRLGEIGLDSTVLLVSLTISGAAGLLFGVLPVLNLGRSSLIRSLKEGAAGSGLGRGSRRLRSGLAVLETALALVLLIGSGLMVRSFRAMRDVQPGFERPAEVLTLRLSLPRAAAEDPQDVVLLHERILEDLAAVPGVRSVGAVSAVTLDPRSPSYVTYVEGFPTPENNFPPSRRYKWVAGDYFQTMGNHLLAGRTITWDDVRNRAPVVMVTENFAHGYWEDAQTAIGKRIRNNPNDPWREIVGVVEDAYDDGVDLPAPAIVYWPLVVEHFDGSDVFVRRTMAYVVRSRGAPLALLPELRHAIWSVDPDLPLADVLTLDQLERRSLARTSFTLVMLGIAATVAVLLGTIGIYGVVSFVVAQRTREIGVRLALGAQKRDVRRLVLGQGGRMAALGVTIGLAAAALITRFMSALLFGVDAADPLTYTAAAIGVAAVALLASYAPARRAAAVDPMETLRGE